MAILTGNYTHKITLVAKPTFQDSDSLFEKANFSCVVLILPKGKIIVSVKLGTTH